MKIPLIILFLFFLVQCYCQTRHQKLIVAEFRIDTPKAGNYTYLVSYNFENGSLKSKDTIFGAETFKKDRDGSFRRYVRSEFGGNFIYKGRYVISGTGNVIDIETKKLIIEEGDDFIEAQDDTLIFHRANIFTGTGFLKLDLKSGKYEFINHDKIDGDKYRRSSPDKKHYLSIDQTKIPYKICLHDLAGNTKTIVFDAGHGPNITSGSQRPTIETYWVNNYSFLYAVHKIGNIDSSRHNTSDHFFSKYYSTALLHDFNIKTNSDNVFFVIDTIKQGDFNGKFLKDKIGQIIYRSSGGGYYLVDTIRKTLLDYPFFEMGNDFSIGINNYPDGNIVRHNKTEIGKTRYLDNIVGKGIIAFEQGENKINIWSDLTNTWTTIEIPWISNLIGWIDEE